jgi:hypothetical protein
MPSSQIMNGVHGLLQFIHVVKSLGTLAGDPKVKSQGRRNSRLVWCVSFRGSLLDTPIETVVDACPSPFDVGQPPSTNAAPWCSVEAFDHSV